MHANEQDSERVQALRHQYRYWLDQVDSRNFVFIDESGVNLAMTRVRGRSPIGERLVDSTPRNYGQNISVLGALSFDGVLAVMTIAGSVDTAVFRTYITQGLVPQLWQGAIVLCDNLQVHKAAGIREAIEAVGAKLVFLPPYSPDLSPIELCWSKLKHLLRSAQARTHAELNAAIAAALDLISPDDAAGWFAHCGLFN